MADILIVAANPSDTGRLALFEELRAIEAGLREAKSAIPLSVITKHAARAEDVVTALAEARPQVVHFSGHCRDDGALILTGNDDSSWLITPEMLTQAFSRLPDRIQLMVLNGCHTRPTAEALLHIVGCALATNGDISDPAASVFAKAVYMRLASGDAIARAFLAGRAVLDLKHPADSVHFELLEQKQGLANRTFIGDRRIPDDVRGSTQVSAGFTHRETRLGHRSWTMGLSALFLAIIAFATAAFWWPPVAIPPFAERSGVVVSGSWLGGDPEMTARDHLTRALQDLGEAHVHNADLPWAGIDDKDLVDAAGAAGASLVVRIDDGPVARILSVPETHGLPLLDEIPPLRITQSETRDLLARLLFVMAWSATHGPAILPRTMDIPIPEPARLGPELTVLAVYLAELAGPRRPDRISDAIAALQPIVDRCRGANPTTDWLCPLTEYVYFARLRPGSQGTLKYFEQIRDQRNKASAIASAATQAIMERRCHDDPVTVLNMLDQLNGELDHHDCRRLGLAVPAQCVILAVPRSPFWLRILANPRLEDFAHCADVPGRVLAGRAALHGRAGQWTKAARLYLAAAEQAPANASYMLDWAAARLQDPPGPGQVTDVVARRIESGIDMAAVPGPLRIQAHFLLWLGGRKAHHAKSLCSMYANARDGRILMQDLGSLGTSLCTTDRSAQCRVYRVLTHAKSDISAAALCKNVRADGH